jgi:hypothetical protein
MDGEQTIAEIEWLERIFTVPDTRPLSASDLAAANRGHDEKQVECQAKTRPPVRHTGVVDEGAMKEVKNAVPNKGSDY